ncbi:hypothetical protein [Leifsonia aquatica]|uniref:hypothetical protein n=1 Tax=Leifsonia aquatica TaxID=144185 RepID=UPI003819C6F8
MRFSEHFDVTQSADDDWFDPHLTVDTKLFVDPLLLLEAGGEWAIAHEQLIAHFVHCYGLVAKATSSTSISAQAARRLLTFPEPFEVGLGYTTGGTNGSGAGDRFAATMADGIATAIAAGLAQPEHIEEIGILNVGIGPDRISDATVNVLKARFIAYTQAVAERHGISLDMHRVKSARVSLGAARWIAEDVLLPTNPNDGRPIILLPRALLNELPTLNADDWFDSHFNEDIRLTLNLQVGKAVRKADIVSWARRHPDRVREWAREQTSRQDLRGYDFSADPLGVVQWDQTPAGYADEHPLMARTVTSHDDLLTLVGDLVDRFQHFVEEQRGWNLLWNSDGSEKPEEAAQLLFLGLAQPYLRQFNVEIDREVELGRGPVDFKAASGTTARVLIEVKKVHNGKFWNGLEAQLPSYLTSDGATHGWFLALQYRDTKSSVDRVRRLPEVVTLAASRAGMTLRSSVVDVRKPASASNLNVSDEVPISRVTEMETEA